MVTLTSRYQNCSTETNVTTYYLPKEEKRIVLTCQSPVPNRWVWNTNVEWYGNVKKERLEVDDVTIFSSKLTAYYDYISDQDGFSFSCTNEIEYKDGPFPVTCVTVHQTVDNDTYRLGPVKLSVFENIDSLQNCILTRRPSSSNSPINLAVDMSNITGVCKSKGELESQNCVNLDYCKSLIYTNAENETCEGIIQTFNETSKHQKSLINHDSNSPQIAICQVVLDRKRSYPSFLLLYPSFGKREWEKFDYYANMTEALGNNSIQLFALSQYNMKGTQTITGRNEFAENENVEFFCKAILFLYMRGFRLRLGSGDSKGTVVEGQKQNHTSIDENRLFYNFSQNIPLSTKKYGNISWISCDGPVWNSRDWFSSTINISIYPAEKPYVKLNGTVGEFFTTFVCTYCGWPRPNVTWTFSEAVEFSDQTDHVPDTESYNTTWSQTRVIINLEASFKVTCTVENFIGSQFISMKAGTEKMDSVNKDSSQLMTVIVSLVATVVTIIFAAALTIVYLLQRQSKILTDKEISQFFNGGDSSTLLGSPESVSGPYQKVHLELSKRFYTIDESSALGSGAYGRVCRGVVTKDGGDEAVAVKMTKVPSTGFALRGLLFEIKILSHIGKHPHIVGLVGAYTTELRKGKAFVFLEFCELGSLQNYLRECKPPSKQIQLLEEREGSESADEQSDSGGGKAELTDSLLRDMARWSWEIANGMEFIASKHIVHLDIATRNILLTAEKQAKITDFGLSRRMYDYQSYIKKNLEPLPWRSLSPESLRRSEFTEKSDVWAFGVLLWEIYSLGDEPFPGLSWDVNFPTKLEKGLRPGEPTYNRNSTYSIMLRCWTINPERRPTFSELVSILKPSWLEAGRQSSSDSNSEAPARNYANTSESPGTLAITEQEIRNKRVDNDRSPVAQSIPTKRKNLYERNRMLLVCVCIGLFILTVAGVIGIVYFFMDDPLTPAERANVILKNSPLIDGKNDFAYNLRKFSNNDLRRFNFSSNISQIHPWKNQRTSQTDLLRLKAGNVGAQIWVARADCDSQYKDAVAITLEQIDLIKRLVSNYSSTLKLVNNSKDIEKAAKQNKIGSLISIEGGHSIQSSLGVLRMYYDLGVRMMTLSKGCSTPWVDYAKVDHVNKTMRALPYNHGITKFGEDVIAEMNRLGMIIDVSHTSRSAMRDILEKSKAPVIFSNSAARNICDSEHNLQDSILRLAHDKKALIMITFDSRMITCNGKNSTLNHVIEHINYIKTKTSIDNIGIGSNFDGMDRPVKGLEDVSKFPNLFAALIESGWDYGELERLAGKNFIRVFAEVEKVRDNLHKMDPLQTFIERKYVKKHWDKDNCTSRYGLFPTDTLSTAFHNFTFPTDLFSRLG